MNKTWSIRGYEDGDEKKINELFNLIFKSNRSPQYWQWEFKNNPEGFKALIAEDDHNIIGHLGALKRLIKMGDSEIPALLEVDGMTHPNYERQGIFVALGNRLLSESEKEGVGIVYGFPNENALPGHRKLKCVELFKLHVMIRPVNFKAISRKTFPNRVLGFFAELAGRITFRLFYRPIKAPQNKDLIIKEIKEFDQRFDDFWRNAQSTHKIILKRNCQYLNWRFAQNLERDYKIFVAVRNNQVIAWIVVRIMDRFGLKNGAIVDILALPNYEDDVSALIINAVEYLKQKNVDLIACSIPKWSSYYDIFRRCGFMTCPPRLNPKEEPFIIYPISKDLDLEFLKEVKNWYISWGDTDVV
jgi:hypothetical protein